MVFSVNSMNFSNNLQNKILATLIYTEDAIPEVIFLIIYKKVSPYSNCSKIYLVKNFYINFVSILTLWFSMIWCEWKRCLDEEKVEEWWGLETNFIEVKVMEKELFFSNLYIFFFNFFIFWFSKYYKLFLRI